MRNFLLAVLCLAAFSKPAFASDEREELDKLVGDKFVKDLCTWPTAAGLATTLATTVVVNLKTTKLPLDLAFIVACGAGVGVCAAGKYLVKKGPHFYEDSQEEFASWLPAFAGVLATAVWGHVPEKTLLAKWEFAIPVAVFYSGKYLLWRWLVGRHAPAVRAERQRNIQLADLRKRIRA